MPRRSHPDFGRLVIKDVIIHEIPRDKASEKADSIELSDGPAPVGQNELNFFCERITQSINSHGVATMFQASTESPVPETVERLLGSPEGLVPESRRVALYLYQRQPGVSPEGLLVALVGTVGSLSAVGLMKLQKEAGLRVRREMTEGGGRTLTVQVLNELMLTQRTKVFKVGLFVEDDDGVIHGRVSDEQLKSNVAGGVAAFFMDVLGCRSAESPPVLTRRFFEEVRDFITNQVDDSEVKLRYADALHVELTSHLTSVEPRTFIQTYIDEGDRDRLEHHLRDRDVPLQAFPKDVSGIEHKIRTRSLRTAQGVLVKADASTFERLVTIEDLPGSGRAVVVRDAVRNV